MYSLLRWQDVADIIIMSFLVYQLYSWFKHTKAFQVVIGLSSLGVVYLVTKNLGFFMTSWILQELGTAIFVLIIVIFQTEIRQALYRISPLRGFFGRQDSSPTFDFSELCAAIFSLAASRTGAILVFQRTEPIDEYITNGVSLDSSVNGHLLGCIFKDGSPLHDGALIIRNGRIVTASCHLPLSTSSAIPQHFGTRHRAGLGLAERSDAAVVIVSEERGEVSLALSQTLEKIDTAEGLSARLESLLQLPTREEVRTTMMKRIFGNLWPKLVTVVLVFICWLIITARQGEIITVTAPVQFRNSPETLFLRSASAEEVELQLKIFSSLIQLPKEGELAAEIDLSKARVGVNKILFRKEDFTLPSGVVITRINPSSIRVIMEKKVRKIVRVSPRLTGTLPAGLHLKSVTVVPSEVMLEGPDSVMARIESVRTEEIRLPDLDRNSTVSRKLEVPAHLKAISHDAVVVKIHLGK
ncbi:MAG: diadenylate cyclase CdaA [Geobacteraceae bacterium]|nr:diadenylate cyclase CdaA [Geobacteraceae bacterium]